MALKFFFIGIAENGKSASDEGKGKKNRRVRRKGRGKRGGRCGEDGRRAAGRGALEGEGGGRQRGGQDEEEGAETEAEGGRICGSRRRDGGAEETATGEGNGSVEARPAAGSAPGAGSDAPRRKLADRAKGRRAGDGLVAREAAQGEEEVSTRQPDRGAPQRKNTGGNQRKDH